MRKMLYFTVFTSGLVSLAVEMAASRLIGNYFGASNLVWASIIGLILIYLTAGYFIGGRWADRSPRYETFFRILIWSGFSVGLIPLVARPLLRFASQAFDQLQIGILIGSFITVMILFVVPVTLMGTASPFAIRLAITDAQHSGSVSGKIYAISTIGSFLGTFLPGLILIPAIGTFRTFIVCGSLLLLVALVGLTRAGSLRSVAVYLWMPVVLLILAVLGSRGFDKAADGLIYETESGYNYIQVLKSGDFFLLRLNEGQGIHSIYSEKAANYHGPWEQVLSAPFFYPSVTPDQISSMAILGLAAGTTARQAFEVYPNIHIDGYEIDPRVVEVARSYFGMTFPNLDVKIQDARWGLAHSPKRYQIISVDAYRPPYIPWHLTTQEFFQVVKDHLSSDGTMVINVGRGPSDRRLIDALYTTISSVFPSVYIMDLPNTLNSIIFATAQPTLQDTFLLNTWTLSQTTTTPRLLIDTLNITAANLQPAPLPSLVFTDDQAPIEEMTNSMILDFFLSGDLETLQ